MNRRCTRDSCLAFAGARSVNLDLPIATVLTNPRQEWGLLAYGGRVRTARELNIDWKKYNPDDYLFTHVTIVSSVEVEDNGYYIKPACSELVNNNGNAWSNEVLLATFRSFVGGENYLEHCQVPELSKGKILDAILRPVHYKSKSGEEADVYFCDILVATHRKHESLVSRIISGELTTMSMGCIARYVQCSRCGKVFGENDSTSCNHLNHQMLQMFKDKNGVKRIVAELCGRLIKKNGKWVGDPDSVKFIEASWVEKPAFTGAVLNHYVSEIPKEASEVLKFPTSRLAETVDDLFRIRVADKAGMIVLNVARAELSKRIWEARLRRIAANVERR